ncbi:MAG: hypothetical protein WAO71_13155 [Gallionella sp.]
MAALFNALILLIAVGGIAWEALVRFNHPVPIQGSTVMLVAAMGVVINGITAWLFMLGNENDLNMRGTFLQLVAQKLHDEFGIEHATIQIEADSQSCTLHL